MTLPSAPKRGEGTPRRVHFTYTSTAGGSSYHAYIAGPTIWLYMHPNRDGSKPCLHELTDGQLVCQCDARPLIPVMKGWVPLYRESDYKPICVPVNEESRDHLDTLALHTRVVVARERSRGSAVTVVRALSHMPIFATTIPERRVAADLTTTLLFMFKMPELIDWYQRTQSRADALPISSPSTAGTLGGSVRSGARADVSKANSDNAVSIADALAQHRRFGHLTKPGVNGDRKGGE